MQQVSFDTWTEKYDRWFETPVGRLVKHYETELLLELLNPLPGERILDVGCGSGIFSEDVIAYGAGLTGIDISPPMLHNAIKRTEKSSFNGLCGDMRYLPFADNRFDKSFSMTAIEFVEDAERVITELERVTVAGGIIVVTTLNSLSPWAERRKEKGKMGHDLFQNIYFRSPDEIRMLIPRKNTLKTAIHFQKTDAIKLIPDIEEQGRKRLSEKGAFLAVRWNNPS